MSKKTISLVQCFPVLLFHLFQFIEQILKNCYCYCCSVAKLCLTVTLGTAVHQAYLSFIISLSLLKLMSIESVMSSNHLMLCCPLIHLSSNFPNINEWADHIRCPDYCIFSFSPSNEYSGLISFRIGYSISLQSKGLSRVFSNTTVEKHLLFGAQPSLWPNHHIHTLLLEKPYL